MDGAHIECVVLRRHGTVRGAPAELCGWPRRRRARVTPLLEPGAVLRALVLRLKPAFQLVVPRQHPHGRVRQEVGAVHVSEPVPHGAVVLVVRVRHVTNQQRANGRRPRRTGAIRVRAIARTRATGCSGGQHAGRLAHHRLPSLHGAHIAHQQQVTRWRGGSSSGIEHGHVRHAAYCCRHNRHFPRHPLPRACRRGEQGGRRGRGGGAHRHGIRIVMQRAQTGNVGREHLTPRGGRRGHVSSRQLHLPPRTGGCQVCGPHAWRRHLRNPHTGGCHLLRRQRACCHAKPHRHTATPHRRHQPRCQRRQRATAAACIRRRSHCNEGSGSCQHCKAAAGGHCPARPRTHAPASHRAQRRYTPSRPDRLATG